MSTTHSGRPPATLSQLVAVSEQVRRSPGGLEKRDLMAAYFAGLSPEDMALASSYLAGEIRQGSLGVGWRRLQDASASIHQTSLPLFDLPFEGRGGALTLADLDSFFERLKISGKGAAKRRVEVLQDLTARLGHEELAFVRSLILGEVRQGALRAMVVEALSRTFEIDGAILRRAVMLGGSFDEVVRALAKDGLPGLSRFRLRPHVPIEPMLASAAKSVGEALEESLPAAVEWKLDGVRVQVHGRDDEIRVFTRQLRDVTELLPDVVRFCRGLESSSFILDGEVIGLDERGRPVAFQDLMSVVAREDKTAPSAVPGPRLKALFFDVLYAEGREWIDAPFRERRRVLERLIPEENRIPALEAQNVEQAEEVLRRALDLGHEGVVVKRLDSPYVAGRRGAFWRKVKPAITLDLVILAAEWGHGRRRGFLSNLHLGARNPEEPGRFLMLGKTFKGLTDEMLAGMTQDLLSLETHRDEYTVFVEPKRVVEVAFDGVQKSPHYDSGVALRFARVKRFRPDKGPEEASTIDEVMEVLDRPKAGFLPQ
jgi:DNA ligase-1